MAAGPAFPFTTDSRSSFGAPRAMRDQSALRVAVGDVHVQADEADAPKGPAGESLPATAVIGRTLTLGDPMVRRDLGLLMEAAARVEADLRRTDLDSWRCTVTPDYRVQLADGEQTVSAPLEPDVQDERWYVIPGLSAQEQRIGFELDAAEAVAQSVIDLLGSLGIAWPACPVHETMLGPCTGAWCCPSAATHGVPVGQLDDETFCAFNPR